MKIIGIDCGITGAVALITDHGADVFDCPIFEKMKGKERTTYDPNAMFDLLQDICTDSSLSTIPWVEAIVIEQLHATNLGTIANFSKGLGFGYWHMAAVVLQIPLILIGPTKWKKAMGLTKSKDDSRQRAIELFPQLAPRLKLKKNHGRAEAILLAEYGRRIYDKSNNSNK
jgi:hypothetical protein